MKPGQLVVINRNMLAYRLSDLDDIPKQPSFWGVSNHLTEGASVMVMRHYVLSGSIHNHYSPEQPMFSEVLVFLHDSRLFYISGNRLTNQSESSLVGKHVTIPACLNPK